MRQSFFDSSFKYNNSENISLAIDKRKSLLHKFECDKQYLKFFRVSLAFLYFSVWIYVFCD